MSDEGSNTVSNYNNHSVEAAGDSTLNPVKGEMAMWEAVLTQALMDAGSQSKKPEAQHEKAKAIRWLLGFSEDFVTVCLNAGKNPEKVRDDAKAAIARGCAWRQGMESRMPGNPSTPSQEQKHSSPNLTYALPSISMPKPTITFRQTAPCHASSIRGGLSCTRTSVRQKRNAK